MRQDGPDREVSRGRGAAAVICDVQALRNADMATLDTLAHLQLAARRAGFCFRLINVSPALRALLSFSGFTELFEEDPASEEGAPGTTPRK